MKSAVRLLPALAIVLVLASAPANASSNKNDKRIEAIAKKSYVFQNYLKEDDIQVRYRDGVVTLSGSVLDESRKSLAQEPVTELPGVKKVDNRLEGKGDSPAVNPDLWVATKVKSTLLFHRSVSAINTDVDVKAGIVTLRGEASSQAQKDLTTEYAKNVEGVKDVTNNMTVGKSSNPEKETVGEGIDDASITAQVKMSLLFHRSTSALNTKVKTKNGMVTLSGKAKNGAERDLAAKFANDIHGVKSVTNRMTI